MKNNVQCQKCAHNTNAEFSNCEKCSSNLNSQFKFEQSMKNEKPNWSSLNKIKHHKSGKKQDAIPSMKKRK